MVGLESRLPYHVGVNFRTYSFICSRSERLTGKSRKPEHALCGQEPAWFYRRSTGYTRSVLPVSTILSTGGTELGTASVCVADRLATALSGSRWEPLIRASIGKPSIWISSRQRCVTCLIRYSARGPAGCGRAGAFKCPRIILKCSPRSRARQGRPCNQS